MRLLPIIVYLFLCSLCCSCISTVSDSFIATLNEALLEERLAMKSVGTVEWIPTNTASEQQILNVVFEVKDACMAAAEQTSIHARTERLFLRADSVAAEVDYPGLTVWVKSQIGFYYYRLAALEKALPYFTESAQYLANDGLQANIDPVDCLLKNAYFFGNIGDQQAEVRHLEMALRAAVIGVNDTAVIHYALGYAYHTLRKDSIAKEYFLAAKAGARHRDPVRYAKALGELALFEMNAGHHAAAEKLLWQDIQLSEQYADPRNATFARIRLSRLYIDMQRWKDAAVLLQKAEEYVVDKDNLLGFRQEIISLNLFIAQQHQDQAAQLALHRELRTVEDKLRHTDGVDAVMKVKINVLKQEATWSKLMHEGRLQQSNLQAVALLSSCALLIVFILALRVSKKKALALQQSEFQHQITTIELDKVKSESKYTQAQETIRTHLTFIEERNQAIDHLKDQVAQLGSETGTHFIDQRNKLEVLLSEHLMTEENWCRFKRAFITEYPDFYTRTLRDLPGITESQLRIVLLQKVGSSNHEMANLLGVSQDSIKKAKQRLRKKYGDRYTQCFQTE